MSEISIVNLQKMYYIRIIIILRKLLHLKKYGIWDGFLPACRHALFSKNVCCGWWLVKRNIPDELKKTYELSGIKQHKNLI